MVCWNSVYPLFPRNTHFKIQMCHIKSETHINKNECSLSIALLHFNLRFGFVQIIDCWLFYTTHYQLINIACNVYLVHRCQYASLPFAPLPYKSPLISYIIICTLYSDLSTAVQHLQFSDIHLFSFWTWLLY